MSKIFSYPTKLYDYLNSFAYLKRNLNSFPNDFYISELDYSCKSKNCKISDIISPSSAILKDFTGKYICEECNKKIDPSKLFPQIKCLDLLKLGYMVYHLSNSAPFIPTSDKVSENPIGYQLHPFKEFFKRNRNKILSKIEASALKSLIKDLMKTTVLEEQSLQHLTWLAIRRYSIVKKNEAEELKTIITFYQKVVQELYFSAPYLTTKKYYPQIAAELCVLFDWILIDKMIDSIYDFQGIDKYNELEKINSNLDLRFLSFAEKFEINSDIRSSNLYLSACKTIPTLSNLLFSTFWDSNPISIYILLKNNFFTQYQYLYQDPSTTRAVVYTPGYQYYLAKILIPGLMISSPYSISNKSDVLDATKIWESNVDSVYYQFDTAVRTIRSL